ncbi:DUF1709-domain-containing protein [Myriangium duriaei CBS 260.36]|uniref:DUF1709-domain-containing protein n=1 Tax=Myriangium duriaei CBS 260.36 TaxID=1168546 RepID=A0A9P4J9T7_9PEZI|nr:DUF1709-domain-containing protein [Myriangium duriaei CBS 260.36]
MAGDAVQPLRINKMASTSSPTKLPRPLAEIGSTERRRNSPSYNQTTKKMVGGNDSEGSPVRSPRSIWAKDGMARGRFIPENSVERENIVPSKRSSIENLKKQSRVANSPMFARETRDKYDPSSSPIIERPLTDRPLSDRIQQNPFTKFDTFRKENSPIRSPERPGHKRTESRTDIPITAQPQSPPQSPQKSSLTSRSRYGNSALALDMEGLSIVEDGSRAPTPRQSLRPAKSVTFETAPPETHEYEQQTPEPSSIASGSREGSYESDEFDDNSFERGSSAENDEDSFDASLEDTDKTPVVLPGDWRNASPDTARTDLVDDMDDVFEGGSPPPTATPGRLQQPLVSTRSESMNSEGSNRPLPPIPGMTSPLRGRRSSGSLAAAAERASSAQRTLPSPPRPATVSKDEILRMRESGMSREDRMSLMALQESLAEENRRSSIIIKSSPELKQTSHDDDDQVGDLPEFDVAPQISRESILKKVKADLNQDFGLGDEALEQESVYSDNEVDYSDLARVDPDTPIPSRENSTQFNDLDIPIKDEPEESVLDLDHIPQLSYDPAALGEFDSPFVGSQRQSSVVHFGSNEADSISPGAGLGISDNETFSTPAAEPIKPNQPELSKKTSLPFLANFLGKSEYDFGLTDYMALDTARSAGEEKKPETTRTSLAPFAAELRSSLSSAGDDVGSNRSVSEGSVSDFEPIPMMEPPVIPERKATIKTGGKLKARPSGTSADLEAVIAAAQREAMADEQMPEMPAQYRPTSQAKSEDSASIWSQPSSAASNESKNDSAVGSTQEFKLDVGISSSDNELGTSFSLAQEMERVMDAQKKGYLMRQNTKVIVASRRDFSDTSAATAASAESDATAKPSVAKGAPLANGTRKPSAGEKFIQTEPWNGKMRRKSGRKSSGRRSNIGVAPPVPGHESALGTLEEQSILSDDDAEVERGRLFVKVASVKDLDMPLPRNDRLFFQLTLDNGLHCVTTGNLDLGKNAPIGQEFELVVQQDLDFQLTLTTNLPPPPKISQPASFTSSNYKPKSPTKSVFSRLLSSPKKRAEQERRAQAEFEAEERRRFEETERQRLASRPTAWDKMRELVDSTTGSFGRAYISLKSFEEQSYGRMLTTNVPLYNEWAMEKDVNVVSSVRSKRSNGFGMGMRGDGVVRRPPYQIGNLELNLLYIPRGKHLEDSDMPKSMSAALREMKEAERVCSVNHEGYLSQQGGDCPYWRRRFFKLSSTKLTAFHEHTMQPRATINLAKAAKLIDDKTSLIADPAANEPSKSAKKRRKSAFAEEDEGYQFVEEGFRLRFTNGETIDFYADSTAEKDKWMTALSQAIGKTGSSSKSAKWTEQILAHEARLAARKSRNPTVAAPEINVCPPTSSQGSLGSWTKSAPTSPVKSSADAAVVRKEVPRPVSMAPQVPPKDHDSEEDLQHYVPPEARWMADSVSSKASSRAPGTPPMGKRTDGRSRKAVKSMIL